MADIRQSSSGHRHPKTNFTSYLNDTEILNGSSATDDESSANATSASAISTQQLVPKLLPGELEVISAQNVLLYPPPNKSARDIHCTGLLVVTNFKLSFVTADPPVAGRCSQHPTAIGQENAFLGAHDVTLANIESIYQVTDRKRRLIVPNTKISSKLHGLHVVCKNFRVLKFGLRHCQVGEAKKIAEALMKFAFPNQHSLLFSYNYRENYYNTLRNISMFNKRADWSQELVRCGATGWRVLSLEREDSIPSGTLPMHYVIPKAIKEADYLKLTNYFRNTRGAIWVYSLQDASLVRMAELLPTISNSIHENQMIEFVRTSAPAKRQPHVIELSKCLPSVQDIAASYAKLRDLCTPESTRKFVAQDARYLSALDKSSWLLHVSLCLRYAAETAQQMRNGVSVVLQECDGRDTCCLVSSLAQLLLDPVYRTVAGFATLVQKDWVSLGHAFSDRLGHVINGETTEQSPVWLLFLDCVWQLLQQFPGDFEYNETFLTSVWDAAFLPVFDTFLFNCEHDRQVARKNDKLVLRPVWDWGEQFADKDLLLFTNPLYRRPPPPTASAETPAGTRQSMGVQLPPGAVRLPGMANNNRQTMSAALMAAITGGQGGGAKEHTNHLLTSSSALASTSSSQHNPGGRFLHPDWRICELGIWHQCYHRWLPILDLSNGGRPQIDLYHRRLLANVARLQQALQTGDFDDLPTPTNEGCSLPALNAFFPFGSQATDGEDGAADTIGLGELLTMAVEGADALADGSIFDGLSMSQGAD